MNVCARARVRARSLLHTAPTRQETQRDSPKVLHRLCAKQQGVKL